jgi:hypothetical protein
MANGSVKVHYPAPAGAEAKTAQSAKSGKESKPASPAKPETK